MTIQPAPDNRNTFNVVVNSNSGDGQPKLYNVTAGETVGNLLDALGVRSRDVSVRIGGVTVQTSRRLAPDDCVTITPNKQAGASNA